MELSDYQDSNARIKINGLRIESSFICPKFLIEILMQETKPLFTEKCEVKYADESPLFILCGSFALSVF